MEEVTKDMFIEYELIRRGGEFNMITDASYVMKIMGINKDTYFYIIKNYSDLKKKFKIGMQ